MRRHDPDVGPDAAVTGSPLSGEAYRPAEIARRVATMGVAKARADSLAILVLGILAGAFIALGALYFTVVVTGSALGYGVTRLLGGLGFCLGLVLVVIGGGELFTGNNLLAMAWVSRMIGTRDLLRNWALSYLGNVVGCLGTVTLVSLAGIGASADGAVGDTALRIARAKAELPVAEAFVRGILCNTLVCLAVWLAMGGRSVSDKILAILLPISGFVAIGFEHSIANWFLLPFGLTLDPAAIAVGDAIRNLAAVTAGNIVGGTLLVAAVYWVAYLRPGTRRDRSGTG
jgi:formate/nitrite transporter